jgi:peptide subunit release factor 1 (eRF1)
VNRLSVLGAITSTQQRLKLYTKIPPNGLVLYCGLVVGDDGEAKRVGVGMASPSVLPHCQRGKGAVDWG